MSIIKEINLLVKKAQQYSPEEQALIDKYERLLGPAHRYKAIQQIHLKRRIKALESSSPGVTTRNSDGSTTTRWSGTFQGGVTRQQAERDPEAAKKWNMAQQARDMMNASFAGRLRSNTMPKRQTMPKRPSGQEIESFEISSWPRSNTMPKRQTMPNMKKSPLKSKIVVAPEAEEFL